MRRDAGRETASGLQLGDRAVAELAGVPDTADLHQMGVARLARDHTGVEEAFAAQLLRVVVQPRNGRDLDPGSTAPAEVLAARVAGPAVG